MSRKSRKKVIIMLFQWKAVLWAHNIGARCSLEIETLYFYVFSTSTNLDFMHESLKGPIFSCHWLALTRRNAYRVRQMFSLGKKLTKCIVSRAKTISERFHSVKNNSNFEIGAHFPSLYRW